VKLRISKISELTGIHRDTISKRLADLPFKAGKKGAKLYSSEDALVEIYKTDSLEAARAEQARTAAQLNTVRAEELRKTRIPISIVLQVHDEIFQAIAATLKAAEGKLLSKELINQIFDKFRSAPKWWSWQRFGGCDAGNKHHRTAERDSVRERNCEASARFASDLLEVRAKLELLNRIIYRTTALFMSSTAWRTWRAAWLCESRRAVPESYHRKLNGTSM